MNKYNNYSVEDFVMDDYFIQWCISRDKSSDYYWEHWLLKNPEKSEIIDESKRIVISLANLNSFSTDKIENQVWSKISEQVNLKEEKSTRKKYWLFSAASILLFIGGFFILCKSNSDNGKVKVMAWKEYENNFNESQILVLPDSSTVILESFSSIKYPSYFDTDRTVFLKGEAFFNIVKDESKSFFVIANETITRVVGTSFRVMAYEGEETVEVEVTSGKVAVYAQVESEDNNSMIYRTDVREKIPRPNKKLVVTPNQKVIFQRTERVLNKTLIPLPKAILETAKIEKLHFQNEPLVKVLEILNEIYGIDLYYSTEVLKDCTITTQLDDVTLFEKLDIICAALDLNYEVDGTRIFINGKGC